MPARRVTRFWFVFGLAPLALSGCSLLPLNTTNSPTDAVRGYVAKIVEHDLGALRVCDRPYPHGYFKLLIGGMFGPVQALPGSDEQRTLSVIDLDASRLTIVEESRTDGDAVVTIGGVLLERFEPSDVEALFRAYAAESGQPIDIDLLRETLDNVSRGPVELDIRESVPVVLENGSWVVCPPPYTP
jgi:hypothetical protein